MIKTKYAFDYFIKFDSDIFDDFANVIHQQHMRSLDADNTFATDLTTFVLRLQDIDVIDADDDVTVETFSELFEPTIKKNKFNKRKSKNDFTRDDLIIQNSDALIFKPTRNELVKNVFVSLITSEKFNTYLLDLPFDRLCDILKLVAEEQTKQQKERR